MHCSRYLGFSFVALLAAGACATTIAPATTPHLSKLVPPPSPHPRVHLAITDRRPLVNREARLVAGYADTFTLDRERQTTFVVFDDNDHRREHTTVTGPEAEADLERRVDEFLSHGVWEPMELGTAHVDPEEVRDGWDGTEFSFEGPMLAVGSASGVYLFNGPPVDGGWEWDRRAQSPWGVPPGLENCEGQIRLVNVAIDRTTRRVWAAMAPDPTGAPCFGLYYVHTFSMAFPASYPYMLVRKAK